MDFGARLLSKYTGPSTPRRYADDDLAMANTDLSGTSINPLYEHLEPLVSVLTWRYIVVRGHALRDSARLENALWRLWCVQSEPHSSRTETAKSQCTAFEYGSLLSPVVISPRTIQRATQHKTVLYQGQVSALAQRHHAAGSSSTERRSKKGAPYRTPGMALPVYPCAILSCGNRKRKAHLCVRFEDDTSQAQPIDDCPVDSDAETEELDNAEWMEMKHAPSISVVWSPPSLATANQLQRFGPAPSRSPTVAYGFAAQPRQPLQRTNSFSTAMTSGQRPRSVGFALAKTDNRNNGIGFGYNPTTRVCAGIKRDKSFCSVEHRREKHVLNTGRYTMSTLESA